MIDVKVVDSYRFNIDTEKDEMLEHLEKYGYVVVKEVANEEEISQAIDYLWDFMHNFPDSTVRRGKPETWEDGWIANTKNGIMNAFGMGQSNFMWHSRCLPRVKESFEAIWGPSLLTSFDGGNVFRPWKVNKEWLTRGSWWHTDQNGYHESARGKKCVQGFVSYFDANASTGGLCVISGSHKAHTEYCLRNELAYMEGDFLKVHPEDPLMVECASGESEYEARMVCCKAGDLVLWDSRTVVSAWTLYTELI